MAPEIHYHVARICSKQATNPKFSFVDIIFMHCDWLLASIIIWMMVQKKESLGYEYELKFIILNERFEMKVGLNAQWSFMC